MKKLHYSFIILMFFTSTLVKAQNISIDGIQITPFNVTPDAMLSATIMNNGVTTIAVQTVSKLYNQDNLLLLTVKSASFSVVPGLNNSFSGSRKVAAVEYANNGQANYLKTTRSLSSGNFRVCVELTTVHTSETEDEFCDEIESDHNQYLYLISPSDDDCQNTKNPMLIWAHSEPFNVLSKGESFTMIVTEMKEKQSPEEAMNMNTPIMTKNNLLTHNLQYPYEARPLKEGASYAWLVQKVSNGVIVAKTDVWKFTVCDNRAPGIDPEIISLRTNIDGSYYIIKNNILQFKVEESTIEGAINCKIYTSARSVKQSFVVKNLSHQNADNTKKMGYNEYEIDLTSLNLVTGFHTLEVAEAAGKLYLIKFYVP